MDRKKQRKKICKKVLMSRNYIKVWWIYEILWYISSET